MFTWSIFSLLGLVSRVRLLSLEGRIISISMFTWSIFSFLGLVSRARLLSLEGRRRVLFPDTGITRAGLAVSRENSINQFIYRKEILVLA